MNEYEFLTEESKLTAHISIPTSLVGIGLGSTTLIVYGVLVSRAFLSKRNRWIDENGRVFCNYSIKNLSQDVGRGETAIKHCLKELETEGLIVRKRMGFNQPNRLYILVLVEKAENKKETVSETKNSSTVGRNLASLTERKVTPRYENKINNRIANRYTFEEGESF